MEYIDENGKIVYECPESTPCEAPKEEPNKETDKKEEN